MPIYDYKCSDCGHQIEVIQKFSDEPKTLCIECGKEALKKMVSAPSFRLKGGGWYETDFKTGKKKNIASDDTSSNKKSLTNSSSDSKKQPKQDKITK
jgi:putative FmdB family regulatory protein|tara:strand:+ start:16 stop:306 length:291 start_codon:yes stop_codon:yes gene_type:complete